jgi:putative ubiquitin-RnfH superfamily antitoxin RatB of RatAB toxin-antitoxin module
MVKVEVIYAGVNGQLLLSLTVPDNTSIETVIELSNIRQKFPELWQKELPVGIWGKKAALTDVVKDDDRIEIYRALVIDPKTARLKRSEKNT